MRNLVGKILLTMSGLFLLQTSSTVFAGDLGVNVILAGELRPGMYGQVEIGDARPVVVYERPRVVHVERRYAHARPVYLHVPPGHARYWSSHCGAYHACGRPVYFVRSEEYEPGYRYHDHHHDRHYSRHYDRHDRQDNRHDRRHDRREDRHDRHSDRHH